MLEIDEKCESRVRDNSFGLSDKQVGCGCGCGGEESRACPVCGQLEYEVLHRDFFDDRYGHPGAFMLVRCRCSHVMTMPRLNESDLPDLYGNYYPRKSISAEFVLSQAEQADAFLAKMRRWWMGSDNQGHLDVKAGEKMLDIGCGSGFSLLFAKRLGADAYGVEADPNVQVVANELGLEIHNGSIQDKPFPHVSFNLIVLNQVIEHIPNPEIMLRVIAGRLAKSGRVIMVFPNRGSLWRRIFGLRWINWHVPYHLHHFDLSGFKRMAMKNGLQMVRYRTITPNLWTLLQFKVMLQRPVQGQESAVWRVVQQTDGANLKRSTKDFAYGLVRKVMVFLILVGLGVINRCIDIIGQGDCILVELNLRGRQ